MVVNNLKKNILVRIMLKTIRCPYFSFILTLMVFTCGCFFVTCSSNPPIENWQLSLFPIMLSQISSIASKFQLFFLKVQRIRIFFNNPHDTSILCMLRIYPQKWGLIFSFLSTNYNGIVKRSCTNIKSCSSLFFSPSVCHTFLSRKKQLVLE